MKKLVILSLIGLVAQLIDGSLGMAYGLTSTSLLLMFGIAPAIASASVHFAEVVTTAASGASHIAFGNVDKKIVLRLVLPGSIGAFIGACFLSNISGDLIKPYISFFLLGLGIFILYRFLFKNDTKSQQPSSKAISKKRLVPLGLVAGFLDATGGGGWGPVTTPVLLSNKGITARKVIGSVDTSEFAVALSATLGFIISLGLDQINWTWVIALMCGGIIAAPIAAWIVKIVPTQLLGVLVGGLIIITNIRTLLNSNDVIPTSIHQPIYIILVLLWISSIIFAVRKYRQSSNKKIQDEKHSSLT